MFNWMHVYLRKSKQKAPLPESKEVTNTKQLNTIWTAIYTWSHNALIIFPFNLGAFGVITEGEFFSNGGKED